MNIFSMFSLQLKILCYNEGGSLLRAGGNTHLFWFPSSTPLLLTTARQNLQGGDKQGPQFLHTIILWVLHPDTF